ncbi:MAG: hypothetical protein ACI9DF_001299 [Verrucomicrobiales bacterium]|jgi:hypothetical protein
MKEQGNEIDLEKIERSATHDDRRGIQKEPTQKRQCQSPLCPALTLSQRDHSNESGHHITAKNGTAKGPIQEISLRMSDRLEVGVIVLVPKSE